MRSPDPASIVSLRKGFPPICGCVLHRRLKRPPPESQGTSKHPERFCPHVDLDGITGALRTHRLVQQILIDLIKERRINFAVSYHLSFFSNSTPPTSYNLYPT